MSTGITDAPPCDSWGRSLWRRACAGDLWTTVLTGVRGSLIRGWVGVLVGLYSPSGAAALSMDDVLVPFTRPPPSAPLPGLSDFSYHVYRTAAVPCGRWTPAATTPALCSTASSRRRSAPSGTRATARGRPSSCAPPTTWTGLTTRLGKSTSSSDAAAAARGAWRVARGAARRCPSLMTGGRWQNFLWM